MQTSLNASAFLAACVKADGAVQHLRELLAFLPLGCVVGVRVQLTGATALCGLQVAHSSASEQTAVDSLLARAIAPVIP